MIKCLECGGNMQVSKPEYDKWLDMYKSVASCPNCIKITVSVQAKDGVITKVIK